MTKSAEEYFNDGNNFYGQYNYLEAIEKFKKAIEADPNFAIPFSNIALLQKKIGLFFESKTHWKNTIRKYQDYTKSMYNISDYYNLGLIQQNIYHDYTEAQEKFLTGLELDPLNPDLLLAIVKVYQDWKRSLSVETDIYPERENTITRRNKAHFKEKEYFNGALKLFEKKYSDETNKEHLALRAQLYKLGGKIFLQKAIETHKKWIILENNSVEARTGLALLYIDKDKKNYGKACDLLKETVEIDPDNLDNLSLLAKIAMICGDYENAEFYYRKVLTVTDGHMDTLTGLGELYMFMGERFKINGQEDQAEEKFEASKKYFEKAKDLVESDYNLNDASRLLFPDEESILYYNSGYVTAELANYDKKNSFHLFKLALKYFNQVNSESTDYYPAQNAKKKIIKWFQEHSRFGNGINKNGIGFLKYTLWVILLIFQFAFFIGKPTIETKQYSVNNEYLKSFLNENKIIAINDSYKINQNEYLSMIAKQSWPGIERAKNAILELFKSLGVSEKVLIELNKPGLENFLIKEHKIGISEWKPIESSFYITMTFGIFLLLIASYYLNEITRMKIGGIELEKASLQFLPTTTLDIRMGSSVSGLMPGVSEAIAKGI